MRPRTKSPKNIYAIGNGLRSPLIRIMRTQISNLELVSFILIYPLVFLSRFTPVLGQYIRKATTASTQRNSKFLKSLRFLSSGMLRRVSIDRRFKAYYCLHHQGVERQGSQSLSYLDSKDIESENVT